mgnify:CR=1 FL=1|jgi:hypothetical protein
MSFKDFSTASDKTQKQTDDAKTKKKDGQDKAVPHANDAGKAADSGAKG